MPLVAAQQPAVPLSSSNRWILDRNGDRVKLRCINWAGHMEVNVPEGLHHKSIDSIADWISNEGFNCVRLTFSIDMSLNTGLRVEDSFRAGAAAAGVDEGGMMALYARAVVNNPFLRDATVLDVFDAVQSALWERGVMTVLDNHVSRAGWCCNLDDGNGWWRDAPIYLPVNSQYFNTQDWLDGLQVMARWSASRPGIVGISLRNELRAHVTQYPWAESTWRNRMPRASRIVHEANPNALVIIGGHNGGTDLSWLRDEALDTRDWAGKNVWEAHMYSFTVTTPDFGSCDFERVQYGFFFGFLLEQNHQSVGPLFLSEFGVGMSGGPNNGLSDDDHHYLQCLVGYMENNDADWAMWAIQGSYYARDGQLDPDENFGAMDHSWSRWRNPAFKGMLGRMFETTQGP
ncbi:cellulase family protein [Stachybotrys elegans]|uniref:Cellulase family protein n=1 Tax=Stachybotrys elegans TaxID=80388 RepID=A0A8K0SSS0_9HYPO|nr:cellulase family protein [Stachybotrys elegans]